MADLLVDGGADAFGEALVVQRRGDGSGLSRLFVHPAVDLFRGNAGTDVIRHIIQHGHVHLGAAADLLDLGFVFDQLPRRKVRTAAAQGFVFFIKSAVTVLICFSAAAPARGAGFQFFHRKLLLLSERDISIHSTCRKGYFNPLSPCIITRLRLNSKMRQKHRYSVSQ